MKTRNKIRRQVKVIKGKRHIDMMTQENINKEKNDTTNRTLLCVRYLNEFESAAKIVKFIYVHLRV